MFRVIRKRVTYVNVAMTLALVFAMTGGAYAAKKYLITSAKQISPSVLKQLAGKNGAAGVRGPVGAQGPAGPQGPAGSAGAKGDPGAKGAAGPAGPEGPAGAAGSEGPAGESVKVASLSAGQGGCAEGGAEVSNNTGSATACNGKSAGGTLEAEKVEMGTWGMEINPTVAIKLGEGNAAYFGRVAISFPQPLPGEDHQRVAIHFVPGPVKTTEQCPGINATESVPGTLCIYGQEENPVMSEKVTISFSEPKREQGLLFSEFIQGPQDPRSIDQPYEIGVIMQFAALHPEGSEEAMFASGGWVLTAPEKAS